MSTAIKTINSPVSTGIVPPARTNRALMSLISSLQQRVLDLERNVSVQQVTVSVPSKPHIAQQRIPSLSLTLTLSGAIGAFLRALSFVTVNTEATLASSRQLAAGTNITLTDSGAGGTLTVATKGTLVLTALTFTTLPGAPAAGTLAYITDSTVNTWGTNVTVGGGTNKVFIWFNGTNWTVVGK